MPTELDVALPVQVKVALRVVQVLAVRDERDGEER